jgi:hypothetical protein
MDVITYDFIGKKNLQFFKKDLLLKKKNPKPYLGAHYNDNFYK